MSNEKNPVSIDLSSNQRLVSHYMYPYAFTLVIASLFAFALAAVGALLGTLVGPSFKVISSTPENLYQLNNLFGEKIGHVYAYFLGKETISAQALLEIIPPLLLILAALKAVLFLSQYYLWEKTGEQISKDVRKDILYYFTFLKPEERKSPVGREIDAQISSTVTTDVKMFREYIVRFFGGMPREALQFSFFAITLFFLSSKLFYLFFLGVLPSIAIVNHLGKAVKRRASKALDNYSSLSEWLQQRLLGIETIKHYKTEELEVKKMKRLTNELYNKFYRSAKAKARTSPSIEIVSFFSISCVLYIAIADIEKGILSGSIVMSFLTTLGLLTQSASKMGRYYNSNREGAAAVERIKKSLLFTTSHTQKNIAIPTFKEKNGDILKLKNVSVYFKSSKTKALNSFTYDFRKEKIYGLIGQSGAGKSTVFNVILGLIEPTEGHIQIKESNESLSISYMPQNVELLPGSVLENIYYPHSVGDKEKAIEAIEKLGLTELINALPQKFEALIGSGGHGLSGGQAQRLLLARLWYHKSPLILVDEGTSALDPNLEKAVFNILKELARLGSSVLIIAHRLAAIDHCNKVLLLKDGQIIADKTPEDIKNSVEYLNISGQL